MPLIAQLGEMLRVHQHLLVSIVNLIVLLCMVRLVPWKHGFSFVVKITANSIYETR